MQLSTNAISPIQSRTKVTSFKDNTQLSGPDRNLADKLSNKVVCVVVSSRNFEANSSEALQSIKAIAKPEAIVTLGYESFVAALPYLKADVVVIYDTKDIMNKPHGLETGLKAFKLRNRGAVVLAWNTHATDAPETLKLDKFKQNGLLDHVEFGEIKFPVLLQLGADMLVA